MNHVIQKIFKSLKRTTPSVKRQLKLHSMGRSQFQAMLRLNHHPLMGWK